MNFTPLGWDRPPTVPVTNRHNTSPRRGSQGLVQRSATHTSTVSVDYAQQASRGGGAGTAALLMEAAESRTRPARPATESRTRPARPASGTTARALLGFSMLPLPFSEMKTETLPPVTNPANRNVPRVLVRVNSRDSLGHDAAQSKSHIVRTEATRSALYGSSRKSEAVQSTGSRTHREVSTQHMYKRSQDVPPPPPPLPWEPTAARSPRAVADMPDASIIGQGNESHVCRLLATTSAVSVSRCLMLWSSNSQASLSRGRRLRMAWIRGCRERVRRDRRTYQSRVT